MSHFAVLAIGRDRSGIVAAITGALTRLNFNIETSQMGILGDQFSMMLVVSGSGRTREELQGELTAAITVNHDGEEQTNYPLVVTDVENFRALSPPEASYLLTVYCTDRSGVIGKISKELSEREMNITHLYSIVQSMPDNGSFCVTRVYITSPPTGMDVPSLHEALKGQLMDDGADEGKPEPLITIQPLEADPQSTPE